MTTENPNERDESAEPLVQDKRRIDPVTGKVRQPAAPASEPAQADSDPVADEPGITDEDLARLLDEDGGSAPEAEAEEAPSADAQLAAERLADLQRVTAEYANFRRRTAQEQLAAKDLTTAEVLRAILPVLDDLDRAADHGDLPEDGAMTVIASKLRTALAKLGLEPYGEKGELFDPARYEAIAQLPSPDAEAMTVADVVERGYTVGERIVRVAKVAVFAPAS